MEIDLTGLVLPERIDIVETSEDFGSQGSWPTHPQLLDWLAREFIESGWDVKHMLLGSTTEQIVRLAQCPVPDRPRLTFAKQCLC